MIFTTHIFLFYFLPAVLLAYYWLPFRARTTILALASYIFYGWANPWWALVMFWSTIVDYICGLALVRRAGLVIGPDGEYPAISRTAPRTRAMRRVLWCSVASNLAVLGFFKYTGFALDNLRSLSQFLGLGESAVPALQIALPVGISFYTFQSMSYIIDVYRGDARPMRRLVDFCCFEALFPQLVAGPIVRYAHIAEQMRRRSHTYEKFARGVAFFACGMAKKLLIANPLALIADKAFAAGSLHWFDAWYGLLSYALQLYFDFSGYSDMAVGLGLMLGFLFVRNFDSPYRAHSITDFWRRWHISLSTWLRDYLYIPLGGNRRSPTRTYVNLMLVMLLGGLWHGAAWTFVIWGALHGLMLGLERSRGGAVYGALPGPLRVALTFLMVCLAWVFFRADSLPRALDYLAALFALRPLEPSAGFAAATMDSLYHRCIFVLAALIVWLCPQTWQFTAALTPVRALAVLALLVLSILFMWGQSENPFIYFQF